MNVTVAREIERYNLKDVNKDCEKAIKDFETKKDIAFMRLKQELLEKMEAQEKFYKLEIEKLNKKLESIQNQK
ncbi:hypothetical protein SCHIN_v1c10870 [Spiroplasma chinense]|uniref:Uncharacterized protein n=1 Tax=Spiroplasma chinense TaxID=216932 RepID=A0A5B9Y5P9_9MOLU|nr:hypothetical protein [Spiroplasma chinense]QEH62280.1 hypothetical protein SCHIN_v1c10870 [Spiroplasma chinense]